MPVESACDDRPKNVTEETGSIEKGYSKLSWLVLAFQAERPLEGSVNFSFEDHAQVWLARADEESSTEVRGQGADAALWLKLRDRFISDPHFSLQRVYGRWRLQDEESRNGTFVDGVDADQCELKDSAVLEAGRSLFVFRKAERQESSFLSDESSRKPGSPSSPRRTWRSAKRSSGCFGCTKGTRARWRGRSARSACSSTAG